MHALKFVPIDGRVTLDSHVEGQPDQTLRKMLAAQDNLIEQALSTIREAQEERALLLVHLDR